MEPELIGISMTVAKVSVGDIDVVVEFDVDEDGNAFVSGVEPVCLSAALFVANDSEVLAIASERLLNTSRDSARAYWRTGEVV